MVSPGPGRKCPGKSRCKFRGGFYVLGKGNRIQIWSLTQERGLLVLEIFVNATLTRVLGEDGFRAQAQAQSSMREGYHQSKDKGSVTRQNRP